MLRIATIGFFDGVHKGHRFLFDNLRKQASERGLAPLIVTFAEHPRQVLQSDFVPRLLTTQAERTALLSAYGELLVLRFEEVQSMTAEDFMRLLKNQYQVSVLLMGYDHRFGSDRLKHPQDYRRIGERVGVEVMTMTQFTEGEWHVSSTEIRNALESGNIALANELLGRPYALCGTVVHGKAVGRTIGFPTANIAPSDPHKVIPKSGVYVVSVKGKGLEETGFCNIDAHGIIEVHIPAFKGDLYNRSLEIQFLRFLRDEQSFTSLDDLQKQIKADIDNILHPDA